MLICSILLVSFLDFWLDKAKHLKNLNLALGNCNFSVFLEIEQTKQLIVRTISRLINNVTESFFFTSIELKVIKQFVQITYSCLEEAVHAGLKQRALYPPLIPKRKKKRYQLSNTSK